jgi:DNA-binding IscR family transcriptional regulator
LGGFLESARGQIGGYTLSRPADKIIVSDVLSSLGGKLYDEEFCNTHTGEMKICTNSIDCSIRSLWQMLQAAIDGVINRLTLKDLISSEEILISKIQNYNKETISL